jgi:hypothetical protein
VRCAYFSNQDKLQLQLFSDISNSQRIFGAKLDIEKAFDSLNPVIVNQLIAKAFFANVRRTSFVAILLVVTYRYLIIGRVCKSAF